MLRFIQYPKVLRFLLALLVYNMLPNLNAQNDSFVSVEAASAGIKFIYHERERPVYYPTRNMLSFSEQHYLEELTQYERGKIEAEVDPPAIGIVRSLKQSIYFDGEKLSGIINDDSIVFNGRLAKIDDKLFTWTTKIKSESADEIRVHFSEGNFPVGVKVNLFSDNDLAFHQFELKGRLDEYGIYTTTAPSDHVVIQVQIPLEVFNEGLYFKIPALVHSEYKYFPELLLNTCYEDVSCEVANSFPGISPLSRSTARLSFVKNGLYYFCSGNLLNNSARPQDFQPFLLTADHCFNTQASAASLEARFDFRTMSCNGSLATPVIVNGSNLLVSNSQTDVTLVLLKRNPAGNRSYLGWTTATVPNNTLLHGIHHPQGTSQKYSRVRKTTSPSYQCFSSSYYHYTILEAGQVIGGSSGSAVVNDNNQVIGQLYGFCAPPTFNPCIITSFNLMWGRFDVSYSNNNFQFWLNDGGSVVSMATSPVSSLNFGSVNGEDYLPVTIINNGTVPNYLNLEINDAYITGVDASQFTIVGPSTLYLAPGEVGLIQIRFLPTSVGPKTATLHLVHNADNMASPKTITLTGTGAPATNPCENILSVEACGPIHVNTFNGGGYGAWFSNTPNPCGSITPGKEQIYGFVAPETGFYSIRVEHNEIGLVSLLWKTGSCSASEWNCIADFSLPGKYGNMFWTEGTTYYILFDALNSDAIGQLLFYVSCPGECGDCFDFDLSISPGSGWINHPAAHGAQGCYTYRFYVQANRTYEFKTGCGNGATANYDTQLLLLDNDCEIIITDEDSCEEGRSRIFWTPLPHQVDKFAYIKVKGVGSSSGNYTLAYRTITGCVDIPGFNQAIETETFWQTHSTFFEAYSCRTYRFNAVEGDIFSFKTGCGDGASAVFNTILELYDANGSLIMISADGCELNRSFLEWTATYNGLAYLRVKGFDFEHGFYSLAYKKCLGVSQPTSIIGPTSVQSGINYIYEISPVPGATTYEWSFSGEADITDFNDYYILLTPFTNGLLSVTVSNQCGGSEPISLYLTVSNLPDPLVAIGDMTVLSGETTCFNALHTLSFAGNGSEFIIQPGANVEAIAGQRILLYDGVWIQPGANFHARITTEGEFCINPPALLANEEHTSFEQNSYIINSFSDPDFTVYPNPATNRITIEWFGSEPPLNVYYELFDMKGHLVYISEQNGSQFHNLYLSRLRPGVYILKVLNNNKVSIKKIVKH